MNEWVVLSPAAAGRHDGIGDYAARLAAALHPHRATQLCVVGADVLPPVDTIGAVWQQYSPSALRAGGMRDADRWLDRVHRKGRPIVMTVHEYWPPPDGSLRRSVRRAWLRNRVTRAAARAAALVVTQDISARELREAGVTGRTPIAVIPVGSNITLDTAEAGPRDAGIVLFGQPAAMNVPVMRALAAWRASTPSLPSLTWFGRSTDEMRAWWTTVGGGRSQDVACLGALSESEISRHLRRATVGLAAYADGASARRTTLAALLQHGVPTVALDGVATDDWMRQETGMVWVPEQTPGAYVPAVETLLADTGRQQVMSITASATYELKMSWPAIAAAHARVLASQKDYR
jgi:glycosyltransferase involved in cell wall biosynthesis